MALLPGRPGKPSRLNVTPKNIYYRHIPVILPLLEYNFRQAPEEFKFKTDIIPTLKRRLQFFWYAADRWLASSPRYGNSG